MMGLQQHSECLGFHCMFVCLKCDRHWLVLDKTKVQNLCRRPEVWFKT